jgi:tetratricopeptide (TPR) repeat protein
MTSAKRGPIGLAGRAVRARVAHGRRDATPSDVILARVALDRRQFADAERHLRRALDAAPDCAEVRTLLGIVHESLGEHHAAYQCYRLALKLDRLDTVAGDGLRRYCQRFGYDAAINPAATGPVRSERNPSVTALKTTVRRGRNGRPGAYRQGRRSPPAGARRERACRRARIRAATPRHPAATETLPVAA